MSVLFGWNQQQQPLSTFVNLYLLTIIIECCKTFEPHTHTHTERKHCQQNINQNQLQSSTSHTQWNIAIDYHHYGKSKEWKTAILQCLNSCGQKKESF